MPCPHCENYLDDREEAIEACAMMASSDEPYRPGDVASDFTEAIDTQSPAAELARQALWACSEKVSDMRNESRAWWAEAECLLRDGWCIGDKVVKRATR